MSAELWEYANKLSAAGDPDSLQVRGFVQRHEEDAEFQNMVSHINGLHDFQQRQTQAKPEKKSVRKRKKKA